MGIESLWGYFASIMVYHSAHTHTHTVKMNALYLIKRLQAILLILI